MLPVVTSFAMQVGFLLGGQLLIENIFNYPGLGKLMIQAINSKRLSINARYFAYDYYFNADN